MSEKYLAKCIEDGDCLLWTGATDKGGRPRYTIRRDGGPVTVQPRREVYKSTGKPLDRSKRITTICGHPLCLSPEHLKAITPGEVVSRTAKNPSVKLRRHLSGLKSRERSKLDIETVRSIRQSKESGAEISRRTNIPHTTISAILLHKRWKEVTGNPFAGLMG